MKIDESVIKKVMLSMDESAKNDKQFLESTRLKINGFRKSVEDIVGKRKVKYVLATQNQV